MQRVSPSIQTKHGSECNGTSLSPHPLLFCANSCAGFVARHRQQGSGLGSSFDRTRLNAAGPIRNPPMRNVSSDLRQPFLEIYVVVPPRDRWRTMSGGSEGTTSFWSGTDVSFAAGGAGLMHTIFGGSGRAGGPLIQRSGCLA